MRVESEKSYLSTLNIQLSTNNTDLFVKCEGRKKMKSKIDTASILAKSFDDFKTSADKLSAIYKTLFDYESKNADYYVLTNNILEKTNGLVGIDQEHRITFFNEAAEELTGLSRHDVLGKYYWDILGKVPEENREKEESKKAISPRMDPEPLLAIMRNIIINLAHKMRSPLSAIQLLAELLKKDLDKDRQKMVEDILIGVSSLDAVLSNLLLFVQPTKPNLQKADILVALNEALLFAAPAIRQQGISLTQEFPNNELFCCGDIEQLKQVCFNLILNSIQAMPEGGELRVKASYYNIMNSIKIEIQDNGCGISNENIDRVFMPFFTTKEDAGGLGLCIVYKIIKEHNGSIQLNSSIGFGTIVSILLPVFKG